MNSVPLNTQSLAILCIAIVCVSGCGEQVPPEVMTLRSRLLLDEEPTGSITIEDARQQVMETPQNITLIVRVGLRDVPNWSSKNEAKFFVSEGFPGSDYNIGPDHDPSTCPFCKWKWKDEDSKAILEVVDESGKLAPFPAEQIFDVKPDDFIVITGKAHVNDLGTLQVQLTSLFKRPPE